MGRALYCLACYFGVELKDGELFPKPCPSCKREVGWTTSAVPDEPKTPFVLNYLDRRFLKALKIRADDA